MTDDKEGLRAISEETARETIARGNLGGIFGTSARKKMETSLTTPLNRTEDLGENLQAFDSVSCAAFGHQSMRIFANRQRPLFESPMSLAPSCLADNILRRFETS